MSKCGRWKSKPSARRIIDLRLPEGECDVEALRKIIDSWVAPTLAALYVEQLFIAGQGASATYHCDGNAVPHV